ncbi:DedA family protein [Lederbergia galactosidilytica]|uniref:Alkaline phosphatase n=1 Tax=Lederbergia galactosidilytica TaxID=217031 RepID=A0A177ZY09_9BACI|nr:DedA family protein [Lederbergia galactosidilytica]MBP1913488.1 membrane protein DedA with SNARE-associated domain [Lederbergia galactosidilytica]OAK72190.1 alkaline phosphatase [Lederbergia galactosidilytica]
MDTWIIEIMEKFGYVGILFLITIENVFPPIPSEVILTFGGFMTTSSDLTIMGVVWFATLGSVIGAVILYGVGFLVNPSRIEKTVDRWGYLLRLKKEDIQRAEIWFQKHGSKTVFFCRFIPLIRSLISIPAGMARMPFIPFFLLTALGTLIWNMVLVSIGAAVGESWTKIVEIMDVYSYIVYIGLAILLIIVIGIFLKKKRI